MIYTYGDRAMDAVREFKPLPRDHKAAVTKRVEERFGGAVFGPDELIYGQGKNGQIAVVTQDDKGLSMLSEDELVSSIERLAENVVSNLRVIEAELGQ